VTVVEGGGALNEIVEILILRSLIAGKIVYFFCNFVFAFI
jgi:hypothetical protein